jgi:protein-S-isoprenylcysteine O-methyltransferase Ste14
MSPTQILLTVSGFWVLSEIVIMRMKWAKASDATSHDRNSVYLFWACFAIGPFLAGMATGVVATRMAPPLRLWAFWGGLALIPIGIAIRWIAIATLKKYFTVNVAIAKDHRVIDHGIYGIVRHPSYSGTLISMLGLGLAFVNWLSFAIVLIAAVIALGYRITVEEKALLDALGDDYRAYARRTKRLIPGLF